jgi:hypothetical protein
VVHSLWLASLLVASLAISIGAFCLLLYLRIWRLKALARERARGQAAGDDPALPASEGLAPASTTQTRAH